MILYIIDYLMLTSLAPALTCIYTQETLNYIEDDQKLFYNNHT